MFKSLLRKTYYFIQFAFQIISVNAGLPIGLVRLIYLFAANWTALLLQSGAKQLQVRDKKKDEKCVLYLTVRTFFFLEVLKKLMKYIDMDQNFTEVQKRQFRKSRNHT